MDELIPTATYEVASNPTTMRRGDFLYLDGRVYKCPELTPDMLNDVVRSIKRNLDICDNQCSGLRRVWHIVSKNAGHQPSPELGEKKGKL